MLNNLLLSYSPDLIFIDISLLIITLISLFIFLLQRKIEYLFFILILSASFVGTNIPWLNDISSLIRWIIIGLLFIVGVSRKNKNFGIGFYFFWFYVLLGIIFLINALNISWQLQRGFLLAITSISIPFTLSNLSLSRKLSILESIALAASIFSMINIFQLPNNLAEAVRFSGTSKGAPSFALFLGGLLPFTFWGIWDAKKRFTRIFSFFGFVCGLIVLISTGQRTGTLAGLISIIPMIIFFSKEGKINRFILVLLLLCICGYIFINILTPEKITFLLNRYSSSSGLSNRDQIWKLAFNEILKSPIVGHGFGASEQIIESSFHNGFLEVWFNTGVFGLISYIISLSIFAIHSFKFSITNSYEERFISTLAFGYLLGFVFSSIFESIGASSSSLNILLFLTICTISEHRNGKFSKDIP